jgi:hypothetical protein
MTWPANVYPESKADFKNSSMSYLYMREKEVSLNDFIIFFGTEGGVGMRYPPHFSQILQRKVWEEVGSFWGHIDITQHCNSVPLKKATAESSTELWNDFFFFKSIFN